MSRTTVTDPFAQLLKDVQGRIRKKKIFDKTPKKPVVDSAVSDLQKMANDLEDHQCPHYAALCKLAQARIHSSQGNTVMAIDGLVQSANLFFSAALEEGFCENCFLDSTEFISSGENCYMQAIQSAEEIGLNSRSAVLNYQCAGWLKKVGFLSEAIIFLKRSSELQRDFYLKCLSLFEHASCLVENGSYDEALRHFGDLSRLIEERSVLVTVTRARYRQIYLDCELFRLLLILVTEAQTNITSFDQKLIDKYSSNKERIRPSRQPRADFPFQLAPEKDVRFRSFFAAVVQRDLKRAVVLSDGLIPFLSQDQVQLVHLISRRLF